MDRKKLIRDLRRTVDSVAGAGVWVETDDSMTRPEQERALCEGFLREGYAPDQAARKAREFLELAALASAS